MKKTSKWLKTTVLLLLVVFIVIANGHLIHTPIYGTESTVSVHKSFFVSKEGNNDNSGDETTPFKTIQYGVDQLESGDTLYIMEGVYMEQLQIDWGHGYEALVTIKPYENHVVTLDGQDMHEQNEMIHIYNSSNVRIEGLEIKNNVDTDYARGIFIEGSGDTIQLVNNTIHGIKAKKNGHGIVVYGTDGGQAIEKLLISDNHIYDCVLGSSEALVVNGNVNGFIIDGNEIHDVDNIGIDCIGFEGNSSSNDQARNGQVSNNLIYNITSANNPVYSGGFGANGIYVDGGRDIEIFGNTIYNCDIGIEVASEHYGRTSLAVWVHDNYIYNCAVFGLAVGGTNSENGRASSNLFEYNSLYNNKVSVAIQEAADNIFRYNILYGRSQLIEGNEKVNTVVNNLWYSDVVIVEGREPFENPNYVSPLMGDLKLINGFNGYGVRDASVVSHRLKPDDYGEILQTLGIIQGDGNGLNPYATLTREELVTILYRLTEPEGDALETLENTTFTDVGFGHWSSGYIQYAYDHDLTKGISDGLFGLGHPVTYQQSVLFLQRVLGYETEWENALEVGEELGIYSSYASNSGEFYRLHMFELICRMLVSDVEDGTSYYRDHYEMDSETKALLDRLKVIE